MPERRMAEIVAAKDWDKRVHRAHDLSGKSLRALAQSVELSVEDIRDDVVSFIRNSGLAFEDVEQRLGPTAKTLERWAAREVKRPQIGKVRAALRAVGYDLGVVEVGNG